MQKTWGKLAAEIAAYAVAGAFIFGVVVMDANSDPADTWGPCVTEVGC